MKSSKKQSLSSPNKSKLAKANTISAKRLKKKKAQNFAEESWREILGFFTNQVDVRKFLKKHPRNAQSDKLYSILMNEKYLNPNEFEEIRGAYDDYNLGDLILVFQNPDHDDTPNKPVPYHLAETVIDNILTVLDENVSKTQAKRERESFLYSFLTLDDWNPKVKSRKQPKTWKEQEQARLKESDRKNTIEQNSSPIKRPNEQQSKQESGKIPQAEGEVGQQEQSAVLREVEKNSYEKYLEFLEVYKKDQDEKLQRNAQKTALQMKLKELHGLVSAQYTKIDEKQLAYNLIDEDLEEDKLQAQREIDAASEELENLKIQISNTEGEIDEILRVQQEQRNQQKPDPIKEILKVDLSDHKIFKNVKKIWSHGKQMEMVWLDESDYEWRTHNLPPRDFLTLVRYTVLTKLCRNGFLHCRQFVSQTGQHIFIVIKSNKDVITRMACQMQVRKQIELGYADLFSLEPVDEAFRPLRLKNFLRQFAGDDDLKLMVAEIGSGQKARIPELRPGEKVEDHCRAVFQIVCQWSETELRAHSVYQQQLVDKHLKMICSIMRIDLSHEKVELIDDHDISTAEWQAYFVYNEYLCCFSNLLKELLDKDLPEVRNNLAFLYKLIFRKALGDANEFWFDRNRTFWRDLTRQNRIIFSMWNRLDVEPIAPYADYFQPINEEAKQMWRKFEVNEKGLRWEFINMEKTRITNTIVLKNINILRLIKEGLCFAYFPIHDQYQLYGTPKSSLFQKLAGANLMTEPQETEGHKKVQELFTQLKDEAEAMDFDSESLLIETKFNCKIPWFLPVSTIRDYFGEKLALYFLFLSYYSKQLWYLSILGVIVQGMMGSTNKELRSGAIILFSIAIIVWSTLFIEFWKREQVSFSVQFGQQNFEQAEAERPAFEGTFVRSITDDELNEEFYSPFMRKMKQLLSFAVSLLIIGCVIGCVFMIFLLKNEFIQQKQPPEISQQLPSILNSVQIGIFNLIYQTLVNIFNSFENHKILSSYEDAFIGKVFIFRFVNTFNSFFIIAYLESYFPNLDLCLIQTVQPSSESGVNTIVKMVDCFKILENQMTVIFVSSVVKFLQVVITPFVMAYIKDKLKQVDEKPLEHPFNDIDQKIEQQLDLEPYQTNEELDGTVNSYMELVIQFSYLCLFGIAFPSAYILAFVSNCTSIQVDKFSLVKFKRRPFPQGAATIGNWLVILEIITFFGIFTNAGLIVYTSASIEENKLTVFAGLLIIFLILKYLIRFLIPDEPESTSFLNARHQYVENRVVKGFDENRNGQHTTARVTLKIGGVAYSSSVANKLTTIVKKSQ